MCPHPILGVAANSYEYDIGGSKYFWGKIKNL